MYCVISLLLLGCGDRDCMISCDAVRECLFAYSLSGPALCFNFSILPCPLGYGKFSGEPWKNMKEGPDHCHMLFMYP
jgi:hypothetical protein